MLDSHLDEVAFMVQSISRDGRLAFVPLGSWWGHVLPGQRVLVMTHDGERVPAVVGAKPPHFLEAGERKRVQELDEMMLDVGASSEAEVDGLGIRVGDPVVPDSPFREMSVPGVLSAKAFDNRAGVGLMCETLRQLAEIDHPNTVIGVGAVQEELGCRGAGTASHLAEPDVAVVLECAPADDMPGTATRQAVLGKGPQVRWFDPTAVSSRRLVRHVEQIASQNEIPIQLAVRRTGGTDASTIHRSGAGVPTVVISVPARYIHTHVSLLQWSDYVAASRLIASVITSLDADAVAALTRFD